MYMLHYDSNLVWLRKVLSTTPCHLFDPGAGALCDTDMRWVCGTISFGTTSHTHTHIYIYIYMYIYIYIHIYIYIYSICIHIIYHIQNRIDHTTWMLRHDITLHDGAVGWWMCWSVRRQRWRRPHAAPRVANWDMLSRVVAKCNSISERVGGLNWSKLGESLDQMTTSSNYEQHWGTMKVWICPATLGPAPGCWRSREVWTRAGGPNGSAGSDAAWPQSRRPGSGLRRRIVALLQVAMYRASPVPKGNYGTLRSESNLVHVEPPWHFVAFRFPLWIGDGIFCESTSLISWWFRAVLILQFIHSIQCEAEYEAESARTIQKTNSFSFSMF